MKFPLLLSTLIVTLLFACKKDNKPDETGGPAGNKKLQKLELANGQFSGSLAFVYDANGRLVKLHQESGGGGNVTRQGIRISRNAAGMIDKLVYLDDGSRGDSLTILVSSTGQRYTKAVESLTRFGTTTTFTTEFTYDNAGHIVETKEVESVDGVAYEPIITEYTYQNNNVSLVKEFYVQNGTKMLFSQDEFVYDNKNNPMLFGNEWILYSLTFTSFNGWSSANNITKQTTKQQGTADEIVTTSYTYNNQNLPVTATGSSPGQTFTTAVYTYEP